MMSPLFPLPLVGALRLGDHRCLALRSLIVRCFGRAATEVLRSRPFFRQLCVLEVVTKNP